MVGWYLMYPPTPNLRLSQWEILNIFDSATECRNAFEDQYSLADFNRKELQDKGIDILSNAKSIKSKERAAMDSEANSKCIASDDPRLKGR
jgi:hypothetical protein